MRDEKLYGIFSPDGDLVYMSINILNMPDFSEECATGEYCDHLTQPVLVKGKKISNGMLYHTWRWYKNRGWTCKKIKYIILPIKAKKDDEKCPN